MIRTDADSAYNGGPLGVEISTNTQGGHIQKDGQPGFVPATGTTAARVVKKSSYNKTFGDTTNKAAWVEYTIKQCMKVGIDTTGMDSNVTGKKTKTVQVSDVKQSNWNTVNLYGLNRGRAFVDQYETTDERKARHKALRDAGHQPPFPRADKFQKNVHQGDYVQVGLTTEGSYTP